MSGHSRQTAAARQEGQSMPSPTVSGRCPWAPGGRVPVDEGQASLDEALVTVHTRKLLLQLGRRVQVHSRTCNHGPKGKESVVLAISRVFNIIHKVIAKGFALQIILFTLRIQKKKNHNKYFK